MRHIAITLTLSIFLLAAPGAGALRAQQGAYRFNIASAGDSTFSFPLSRDSWVKKGMHGIAVDPARHDVLIARFIVTRVTRDSAVALVTGQTTRVTTDFVALLERPVKPWYLRPTFWLGGVLGAIVGVVASR
ncbi:MAG TPA: hypothetical protein VFT57_06685 [Gemmatimonadaceae bacterium]|nr:hypothetical protein [Gemmatimonadaceae bacterium]